MKTLTTQEKQTALEASNISAGERDPFIKPEFEGKWMVIQNDIAPFDNDEDWGIVGDDLAALIDEAYEVHILANDLE